MRIACVALATLLLACGTPPSEAPDAGQLDSGITEDSGVDAGPIDAGPIDAGIIDAGLIDAGLIDAGLVDAGPIDAGLVDAGLLDAGSGWRAIGPLPPADFVFTDVMWTGTEFLAVGGRLLANDGVVASSPDGLAWTVRSLPTTSSMFMAVSSNGQRFVAVGLRDTGVGRRNIWLSTDGTSWSDTDGGPNEMLHGITWDGARFWAVGQGGTIASSTDGVAWAPSVSGTSQTFFDVLSRGDVLVAIGGGGLVLTSADGQTWNPADAGTTRALHSLTLDGTTFVAVGETGTVLTSGDAIVWTPRTSGSTRTLRDVLAFDGGLVAVGETSSLGAAAPVLLSVDHGASWNLSTSVAQSLWSVTAGPSRLVTVGASGAVFVNP